MDIIRKVHDGCFDVSCNCAMMTLTTQAMFHVIRSNEEAVLDLINLSSLHSGIRLGQLLPPSCLVVERAVMLI
jgi:hypothetical protein